MIPTRYDHYMVPRPATTACAWGGIGGRRQRHTPRTIRGSTPVPADTCWSRRWAQPGMMHSSTSRCAGHVRRRPHGCGGHGPPRREPLHRPWAAGCGHLKRTEANGTSGSLGGANLSRSLERDVQPQPLERGRVHGIQAIQIPCPPPPGPSSPTQSNTPSLLKFYYLEFRGPWGWTRPSGRLPSWCTPWRRHPCRQRTAPVVVLRHEPHHDERVRRHDVGRHSAIRGRRQHHAGIAATTRSDSMTTHRRHGRANAAGWNTTEAPDPRLWVGGRDHRNRGRGRWRRAGSGDRRTGRRYRDRDRRAIRGWRRGLPHPHWRQDRQHDGQRRRRRHRDGWRRACRRHRWRHPADHRRHGGTGRPRGPRSRCRRKQQPDGQ